MRDAFTPFVDPSAGDLALDDGHLAPAASAAVGLVVWTLRTEYGTCPAAPEVGVRWKAARVEREGATVTLQKELLRALQWIADLGYLTNLAVAVTSPAPRRLHYEIAFDPPDGARTTIRGTV